MEKQNNNIKTFIFFQPSILCWQIRQYSQRKKNNTKYKYIKANDIISLAGENKYNIKPGDNSITI